MKGRQCNGRRRSGEYVHCASYLQLCGVSGLTVQFTAFWLYAYLRFQCNVNMRNNTIW